MENKYLKPICESIDKIYDGQVEFILTDTKATLRIKNTKTSVSIKTENYYGFQYFEELVETFNKLLAKQYLKELSKKNKK